MSGAQHHREKMSRMRHTLTLDPDVDARVAQVCRVSGKSFNEVVNALLRHGLEVNATAKSSPPLQFDTVSLGLRPGLSLVSIADLE